MLIDCPCPRLHRSTWVQTELLLTFPPPLLKSVALIPHNTTETNGRFRIWLQYAAAEGALSTILIWDRKTRGGFPDLKEVVSIICAGLIVEQVTINGLSRSS